MASSGYWRISNAFWRNPKVMKARKLGKAALATWILACSYCSDELTDGFVGEDVMLYSLDAGFDELGLLVSVGLLEEAQGGWLVHDYLDYQTSREQVEGKKEADRQRVQQWREKRKAQDSQDGETGVIPAVGGDSDSPAGDVTALQACTYGLVTDNQEPRTKNKTTNNQKLEALSQSSVTVTKVPRAGIYTHPPQTQKTKPEPSTVPHDFQPDAECVERMRQLGIGGEQQADEVRAFIRKNRQWGTVSADWQATFLAWLENTVQAEFAKAQAQSRQQEPRAEPAA